MADPWLAYQRQTLSVPAGAQGGDEAGPWQEFTASASAAPPERINPGREGTMLPRTLAGMKVTPEGRASFLEQWYGAGNVATDADGATYIRDPKRDEWFPFDAGQLNIRDAADLSGDAVAAAPVLGEVAVGARLGTSLVRGLAAGGAGNAVQQGASAALPGDDGLDLAGRAGQLALGAAGGGAANLAGRGTARLVDLLRQPAKAAKAAWLGLGDNAVTREGKDLEAYLGEAMTPGQLSQRRGVLMAEGALRRSPTSAADIMAEHDARQLTAARRRFDDLTTRMSKSPADALLVGGRAMQAFDDTLEGALKVREAQAAADFAAIDSAAGRRPIVVPQATLKALDDLLAKYDVEGAAGDATKGLVRQLRDLRGAYVRQGPGGPLVVPKSAAELQRLLSSWGRAAEGGAVPFLDVANAEQRGIAKRIYGALMDDLDAAAAGTGHDAATAQALKLARENYRANSGAIDELRKTAIGQYLGIREAGTVSPEVLADKLLALKPQQLKQSLAMLDKADPELAGLVKRASMERAMLAARPSEDVVAEQVQSGMPIRRDAFSPAKLLTGLRNSNVYAMLTPTERFEVDQLGRTLARLANRGGSEGSPTAPLQWAMGVVRDIGLAGMGGDPVAAARLLAGMFAPAKLAKAVADPAQRHALITLTSAKPQTKAAITALEALGIVPAVNAAARPPEDVRPSPPLDAALATR